MDGLNRHLEKQIPELLSHFPALILLGVRQCGKTWLSKNLFPDWKYFDLENAKDRDFITRDFDFFFQEYPRHIILDEAQEAPELFKNLRGVIDRDRKTNNRFLITGSSSPNLLKGISESLAGRVAILELSTLKMSEIRRASLSPFFSIFEQSLSRDCISFLKGSFSKFNAFDIIPFILKGGYPDPCLSKDKNYKYLWMKNYFDTYINRDIRRLYPRLDALRFQRFISIMAEMSGTLINRAQIGRALDLSEKSVKDYLHIADQTYIWRQIPAFSSSQKKSLVKMPKGFLRDSGLIHYLLGINNREAFLRSPKLGQIFEAYVIEELLKGLNGRSRQWTYSHYRTKHGAEIDLILQGDFGLLPVEIKFSSFRESRSLLALKQFIREYSLPFALLINNSKELKMLSDEILQIPASFI